ncbi:MAG: 3-deoxy-manno-octulosonate cytidylyltransferase [Pseudomonadota bacterium]|nr:3-deoxy-manno-octulosonate cytidylyltransferase [Pseudomonadota bacterium]
MASPRFTVLIPARLASSRLPEKPLADLGGRPMVVRCCERAQASGAQRVAVATDHPRIVEAVTRHGFEAVLTSAAHATGTDRLGEAAAALDLAPDDIVVNLQGDEPLIDPVLLARVAQRLAERPDAVMATVAHAIHARDVFLNPAVVKLVLDARGDAIWFSRAPLPWPRDAWAGAGSAWPEGLPALRHVGLYAYRRHFLPVYAGLPMPDCERFEALEQLRVLYHGHRIACVLVDQAPAAGVDTPADLARVRRQFDRPRQEE